MTETAIDVIDPGESKPSIFPLPPAAKYFWTKARVLAAELIAEGELTVETIAKRVKKSDKWVYVQKNRPEFALRVSTLQELMTLAALEVGIANKVSRFRQYQDRWLRMQAVIDDRAASSAPHVNKGEWVDEGDGKGHWQPYEEETVAGWSTGLLVHTVKTSKDGAYDEYAVDTGLLGEMRQLEMQAAKELGQLPKDADGNTLQVATVVNVHLGGAELGI